MPLQRGYTLILAPAPLPPFIMPLRMQSQINILTNSPCLLKAILLCLNQLLASPPALPPTDSPFNLRAAPTISITDYLARIFKYMNASPSTLIFSLILIDRVQENHPHLALNCRNVHRLLLTANVVAAKYQDDFFYKNSFYANVGGIKVTLLNSLELEFLALINFNCHVQEDTFRAYLDKLQLFAEINAPRQKQNSADERLRLERRLLHPKRSECQPPKQPKKVESPPDCPRALSLHPHPSQ